MMKTLFATCFLVVCVSATPVKAFDGCGGGYGWGLGLGYDYGAMYGLLRNNVPHFAAFPPVYYGDVVPRSYGYGPFAYPPHVMTPEVIHEAEPLIIENPHVEKSSIQKPVAKPETKDKTVATPIASEPLVISNPYVSEGVAAR